MVKAIDGSTDTPRPAFRYEGRVGALYRIFLRNLLFDVLTLGVFRFWGITRLRRYQWSHMYFEGEPFEYSGRGKDLLQGFLIALVILVILGFVDQLILAQAGRAAPVLTNLPALILPAAATFTAQRYRLSRTLWRGIGGGVAGSAVAYATRALGQTLLNGLCLGLYTPFRAVRLAIHRIDASSFGDQQFWCDGRARRLYGAFLLTTVLRLLWIAAVFWIGSMVAHAVGLHDRASTLQWIEQLKRPSPEQGHAVLIALLLFGLGAGFLFAGLWVLGAPFSAAMARHLLACGGWAHLRATGTLSSTGLMWLRLGNIMIGVFMLGLGKPIVLQRRARFIARSIMIIGPFDPALLLQTSLAAPRRGEGLLANFGGDIGF